MKTPVGSLLDICKLELHAFDKAGLWGLHEYHKGNWNVVVSYSLTHAAHAQRICKV